MSKQKKPKKKYIPKPVTCPPIVRAFNAFLPLEEALKNLIVNNEVLEDEVGNYVYRNALGVIESFEASLDIYINVTLRCSDGKVALPNLLELLNTMRESGDFSMDNLINCKEEIAVCKVIMGRTPGKTLAATAVTYGEERKQRQT